MYLTNDIHPQRNFTKIGPCPRQAVTNNTFAHRNDVSQLQRGPGSRRWYRRWGDRLTACAARVCPSAGTHQSHGFVVTARQLARIRDPVQPSQRSC